MDFKKVTPLLITDFKLKKIRYAVIGGFAMGALGLMRLTVDLDFLVDADDIERVAEILAKYDYRCVHKTKNVSQFVSGLKIFGEIDLLHASREISLAMLKRAKEVTIFEGQHVICVLCPEDIIGLKVQALVNDSSRQNKEYADIEGIMDLYGGKLDWSLLGSYFNLFDLNKKFTEFKKRYGTSE